MKVDINPAADMPVIRQRADFDARSGIWLERVIFNHRGVVLLLCALATLLLGLHATRLRVNASFERMIPRSQPYIQNFLRHQQALRGMSNSVRVVLENTRGTIYDKDFLEAVRKANDLAFLMPGVDRSWMRSLWTPSLRWTEVTEEGFRGGPVMPESWDGSAASNQQLKANILAAGLVGSFVADDFRSTLIAIPLMEKNQETGQPLDYGDFSRGLEARLRSLENDHIKVHIVGFAKLVGDLIDGIGRIAGFFAAAVAIAALFVLAYTRCLRSTALLVGAALLGVVWLLGLLQLLGYVLDPYSVLVPFLIFSIGLSHGAQKMNGIMQDIGRGTDKLVAARYTFRRLFMAGLAALITNVVGFAVLMIVDIPVIQDLAIATSLGVGVLIFTKLVLVPVALSYTGVSPAAARRSIERDGAGATLGAPWEWLLQFTRTGPAVAALLVAALLAGGGFAISRHLKIGDIQAGAPELRADSRYNRDAAFLTAHYGLSNDQFAVLQETAAGGCQTYETLVEADRLELALRQLPGVQATTSAAGEVRVFLAGQNEGNPKFTALPRNPSALNTAIDNLKAYRPELGDSHCTLTPVIASLADHRAETLERVVQAAETFAGQHDSGDRRFLLAAGNAGIEAATNIVVKGANTTMLMVLYGAVVLLCFITFRSWRAVLVALVPLVITSVLCEALMVMLDIGVKVATLPVIALGVGVGVDYALYILSVQLACLRAGYSLPSAYRHALQFTGKVVGLVGCMLAAGVCTWAFSPIKFQADMGILLTFMFLWNMVGALILIPALSRFLLPGGEPASRPAPARVPALAESR
ncbi:MAG: efflux RND transporter permease subunit [Vitreoscilla sp.]